MILLPTYNYHFWITEYPSEDSQEINRLQTMGFRWSHVPCSVFIRGLRVRSIP